MNKKVLLTGGAGFIGHIAIKEILHSTDWEVLTFDRLSYAGDLRRIDYIAKEIGDSAEKRLRFVYHDLKAPLHNDLIKEIPDFPEILRLKILHIILSHHGKLEYGSLKEPQFPEAELIHYVDQVDSKVDYMLRQKEEANTDDPWIWNGKERRHVYLE